MRIVTMMGMFLVVGLVQMQFAPPALAQFTKLHDFTYEVDGAEPRGAITRIGATVYGTTWLGGENAFVEPQTGILRGGTIWSLNTVNGQVNTLHHFDPETEDANTRGDVVVDGETLYGPLWSLNTASGNYQELQFPDPNQVFTSFGTNLALGAGKLYSTNSHEHLLWSLDFAANAAQGLHTFSRADGWQPYEFALQGTTVYGISQLGGEGPHHTLPLGDGTLWSYDTSTHTFTKLYDFGTTTVDGHSDSTVGGIIAASQMLFGTQAQGGLHGDGTLWAYNLGTDEFTVLHHFDAGADDIGIYPSDILLRGNKLYGVTLGSMSFSPDDGTLWSFDLVTGEFSELFTFEDHVSGHRPNNLLLLGNTLYGTTEFGGANPRSGTNIRVGTIWSYEIVPEPGALMLLAVGTAFCALTRRRHVG